MIFVTVGTHEQQFNRLVENIDNLVKDGKIKEEVFIQTGYSTYVPTSCNYSNWLSYEEMNRYIQEAHIVVTHGGPASFIAPLQVGKVPIVVPRIAELGEHVNNHQLEFVREISARTNAIIPVYHIDQLGKSLMEYDRIMVSLNSGVSSNNAVFNQKLEKAVNELVGER